MNFPIFNGRGGGLGRGNSSSFDFLSGYEIPSPALAVIVPIPIGCTHFQLLADRIGTIDGDAIKMQVGFDADGLVFEEGATAYMYTGFYSYQSTGAWFGSGGDSAIKVGMTQNTTRAGRIAIDFADAEAAAVPTVIRAHYSGTRGFALNQSLSGGAFGRTERITHLKFFGTYDLIKSMRWALFGHKG